MSATDVTWQNMFLCGALLLVALRAWRGWHLGVARQVVSLVALAAAYPVAYFGGPHLVPLFRIFGFPDQILAVLGGALLGLVVFFAINIVGAVLFKRTAQQTVGAVRLSYGLLGALFGALFGVVIVWVAAMGVRVLGTLAETEITAQRQRSGRAVRRAAAPPPNAMIRGLAEMKQSLDQGATGRVIDQVDPIPAKVYATLGKVGQLVQRQESMARFLEYPGIQPLAEHAKIATLQRDPQILKEVEERDYLALLRNPRIVEAANDPEVASLVKQVEFEKALDYALHAPENPRAENLERD
jgi:uncharacterized membrane protein required for colicin V production